MKNIKLILSSLLLLLLLNNCGLEYMSTNYNKVEFVHSPEFLEAHGDKVQVNFKGKIPPNYFAKKANMEITPVIVSENGSEDSLPKIILQGESNSGGDVTIFYNNGGDFSYSDEIEYNSDMLSSSLELRTIGNFEDESKVFDSRTLAEGTITTSQILQADEMIAFADHGYEDTTIVSESATIYFLVNKSNIRTSEKSREDVKRLRDFIKKGYETASFEIKSYASPEGRISINDELSNNRNENTLKYAKYLMQKIKADGSFDDTKYTTISVGEDWDGFYNLISKSDISDRDAINTIIKSNKSPDEKEAAIRDMAEVYDAIDKDILPYLRKAEISINAYEPKKSKDEIELLSLEDPSKLTLEELLYSATLNEGYEDLVYMDVIDIYPDDWRAYNNLAAIMMQKYRGCNGEFFEKEANIIIENLNLSIENLGKERPEVLINLGTMSSWNGELSKANDYYNYLPIMNLNTLMQNIIHHNKAILDIRKGDYRKASRYFRGVKSYNSSLVSLLNGNYNNPCETNLSDESGMIECYYLNAIIGARSGNEDMLFSNLSKFINSPPAFGSSVREFPISEIIKNIRENLEFLDYREHPKFIELTKQE